MIIQSHYADSYSPLKPFLFIFLILPLIINYLRIIYTLVKEREYYKRQFLSVMGMSNIAYYMALVLRYTISYLIISVGTMVILQQLVFKNSLLILLIVWHFMFCLALTAQAFFISSFFTYVKKALVAGIFFFALNFFVIFLIN